MTNLGPSLDIGPYRVLQKHLLIVKIFHQIHSVNPLNINGIPNNVFFKILNHDLGQTPLPSFFASITSFPIFFTASPGSLFLIMDKYWQHNRYGPCHPFWPLPHLTSTKSVRFFLEPSHTILNWLPWNELTELYIRWMGEFFTQRTIYWNTIRHINQISFSSFCPVRLFLHHLVT